MIDKIYKITNKNSSILYIGSIKVELKRVREQHRRIINYDKEPEKINELSNNCDLQKINELGDNCDLQKINDLGNNIPFI